MSKKNADIVHSDSSDLESDADLDSNENFIVVEIPQPLLEESIKTSTQSTQSSVTSSYVKVPGTSKRLCMSEDADNTSQAKESQASSLASSFVHNFDGMETESCAGSVSSPAIVGINLVSIDGIAMRSCNRCTFFNKSNAVICSACEFVLVGDRSLDTEMDMDAQIALQLQMEEENKFVKDLHMEECKHSKTLSSQSLHIRAKALVTDVKATVNTNVFYDGSWKTLPDEDFLHLAMTFIHQVERTGGRVKLVYWYDTSNHLGTIPEDNDALAKGFSLFEKPHIRCRGSTRMGQIAVVVTGHASCASHGMANDQKATRNANIYLPLVCFDASVGSQQFLQQLFDRLTLVIAKYFANTNSHVPTTGGKVPAISKLEGSTDVGAGAKHE